MYGIILGFKLLYRNKSSASDPLTVITIRSNSTLTTEVTGLGKYTEYEFQVLAFSSIGNGPSSVQVVTTNEDAPGAPATFIHSVIAPSESHGPRVNLTWSRPQQENGIIRGYNLIYSNNEDQESVHTETFGPNTFSYSVDVLGGLSYQFYVRAVTIKPGTNTSFTVAILQYAPSVGPDNVVPSKVNETTYNISWTPVPREQSYENVILYEVNMRVGPRSRRSIASDRGVNSTETYVVLYKLEICTRYDISVRAYTGAGPGPYGQKSILETSKPSSPWGLTATSYDQTQVTLKWKEPLVTTREGLKYTVKYSGKKDYNKTFASSGTRYADKSKTYTVKDLVPGTLYTFEVYGTSDCGNTSLINYNVETKIAEPLSPVVQELTDESVHESSAVIQLWPAEQRNGPISSYQVIVLRVADGVEVLPEDYAQRLKNASEAKLNFYIAAEIKNDPVMEKSWDFTVGDEQQYESYVNKRLDRGQVYILYQRAITRDKSIMFEGKVSKVAKLSFYKAKDQHHIWRAAVIALSCVVFLQFVVIAFLIWRQKRAPGKTNTPDNCTTSEVERHRSPSDYHISEPGVYMELHPRPLEGQSREPPEYQALQGKNTTPGYYNVGFNTENKAQVEEVYENIENAQA